MIKVEESSLLYNPFHIECVENRRQLDTVSDWDMALVFVGVGPSVSENRSELMLFPVDDVVNYVWRFRFKCCCDSGVRADGIVVEPGSTCLFNPHLETNGELGQNRAFFFDFYEIPTVLFS